MQKVKETADYTIFKKRSGRHGVLNPQKKWIRGEEKIKILLGQKLIKAMTPKKKAEAPAAEAAPAAQA